MYPEGMSQRATYDDANLVLRLYELRREDKLRAAREWFSRDFKSRSFEEARDELPPGSPQNAYFRMVTSYWDMAASMVTSGVLQEELFFESGYELAGCWEKIRDIVPELRQLFGNPGYLKNLEEVARRFERWLEKRSPGSYGVMVSFARGQNAG